MSSFAEKLGEAKTHGERAKLRSERKKLLDSPNKDYMSMRHKALTKERHEKRISSDERSGIIHKMKD